MTQIRDHDKSRVDFCFNSKNKLKIKIVNLTLDLNLEKLV